MDARKRKRELVLGIVLMIGFLVVLAGIFSPVFNGYNGMEYMDNLYNSISKGSAYYIDDVRENANAMAGEMIDVKLEFGNEMQAERVAVIFNANGAAAQTVEGGVSVRGDLGELYQAALDDAEAMYHNNAQALEEKYGYEAQSVLFNWWSVSTVLDKVLSKQKRFAPAKNISTIKGKAIETAYNYFGIEPQSISSKLGIVIGSLVFYVVYTLWYGFAILFMFEGSGFRLEH